MDTADGSRCLDAGSAGGAVRLEAHEPSTGSCGETACVDTPDVRAAAAAATAAAAAAAAVAVLRKERGRRGVGGAQRC